jgi:hypothetical protein
VVLLGLIRPRSFVSFSLPLPLLAIQTPLLADNVAVRFPEGLTRGFLTVTDTSGQKIGDGDLQQLDQSSSSFACFTTTFAWPCGPPSSPGPTGPTVLMNSKSLMGVDSSALL